MNYLEPPDPHTGHHLERDNECGLQASPECDGQLKNNTGAYKQRLTKQGTIISLCYKCSSFLDEQVAQAKAAKKESK